SFIPLFENRAVSIVHPDVLTAGGISETLKIAAMAEEHGIAAIVHMAETPVGGMAAAHVSAAMGNNFIAMEFHSNDVPWWNSLVKDQDFTFVQNGWIEISDKPGLGIGELDDEVLREHINPKRPGLWEDTSSWDRQWAHDRIWS
ncbi:MAG: mandelate racemase/muconate lactonizing enzyme family protein, partial [Methylobacteriaceae bacterium]|nr:mandelate racemase/muconate lactonizing enzyme family protein [Methylobacteriaceae bacterium]